MILKPNQVVVICDSREQRPFDLTPLKMKTGTLATGDYALDAAPDYVVIERKSASDLLGCIGHGRERFEREFIAKVLKGHAGNATRAARSLGISRQMLQRKIEGEIEDAGVLALLLPQHVESLESLPGALATQDLS